MKVTTVLVVTLFALVMQASLRDALETEDYSQYEVDTELVENERKGKALVDEYETIVHTIEAQESKRKRRSFDNCSNYTEEIRSYLSPEGNMDCCKLVMGPNVQPQTRTTTFTCYEYYTYSVHRHCGWFGLSRCPRQVQGQRTQVCYQQEIEMVTLPPEPCPAGQEVCCLGKAWLSEANHCVLISGLEQLVEWMKGDCIGDLPVQSGNY